MELTLEERKARIARFRPIDDELFEALAQRKNVCEEILRTILEDNELTVQETIVQASLSNLSGRTVRLDALCTLGSGKKADIEVQRADNDDHFRRARFYASSITVNGTDKGTLFRDVQDVYIVYITEHDFIGKGKTVYHVEKLFREDRETAVDDGLYEIFVNTAVYDGTDIAELMRCFRQNRIDHPKFPVLSTAVKELKETEGGVSEMSEIMEEYAKEYAKEYAEKQVAEALTEAGMEAEAFMRKAGLSEEQILEFRRLTAEKNSRS